MADVRATIVVHYGEGVSKDAFVLAELDETMNVDADGNQLASFTPDDKVWFLVQIDPTLRIDKVRATDGQVVAEGQVRRDRVDNLLFEAAAEAKELSAIPTGPVTPEWYGRQGTGFAAEGRQVTVAGGVPCLGDVSYAALMQGYRLEPPNIELAADETYTVKIVVYVEAIE